MGVCNSKDTMPSLELESGEEIVASLVNDKIKDTKKPSLIISSIPEDQGNPKVQVQQDAASPKGGNFSSTGLSGREKNGHQHTESPDGDASGLLLVPRQSVLKTITRYGTGSDVTAQGSAEGEFYSKKSCVRFIEGDVLVQDLEESKKMNKISSKSEEVLKKLKELNPEEIKEIAELYDSTIPVTGPWFHSITQSTYSGQCRNMTPHGWGRLVTKKGEVIDAFFQNGMITRFAQIVFSDGTWYRGGFDKKLKNGPGIYVDSFGLSTECTWINGEAAGYTIIKDSKNRILFEGTIEKGMRQRFGRLYDRGNKFEYRGNFLNNQFHGQGRKEYENGVVYEGNFVSGVESGEGQIIFIDGRKYKGNFSQGKPHGIGILTTDYGDTRSVTYKLGQLIG